MLILLCKYEFSLRLLQKEHWAKLAFLPPRAIFFPPLFVSNVI